MTRGKYKSSAEARQAREEAIRTAAAKAKELDAALAEANTLRQQLAEARQQIADGVSADLRRTQAQLTESQAKLRPVKESLKAAEKVILDNYEAGVRRAVKSGFSHGAACNYMDAFTKFVINGEVLAPNQVQVHWVEGGRIAKATKVTGHLTNLPARAVQMRADVGNAQQKRVEQGIET